MGRGLTTALQNALRATVVRAGYMVKLETTGATVYLSTRERSFDYFGVTWLGNSWIRPTFNIQETVELRANSISIRLAGLDPAAVSMVLQSINHSKRGNVWLVAFEESGAVIADPFPIGGGNFDNADVRDSGENAEIILNYENELIRASDAAEFRMTHFSQQARFPNSGDLGFEYTDLVEDYSGFWGRAAQPKFTKKRKTKK